MDKVTRQCPQTTTFLKRKESRSGIEPGSNRGPSAYQPNALPLGQTGSRHRAYPTPHFCPQQLRNVDGRRIIPGRTPPFTGSGREKIVFQRCRLIEEGTGSPRAQGISACRLHDAHRAVGDMQPACCCSCSCCCCKVHAPQEKGGSRY